MASSGWVLAVACVEALASAMARATVMACACDPDAAFTWFNRVESPDCTYEELATVPARHRGLDSKIRTSMGKLMLPSGADRNPALVSHLKKKREEAKKEATSRAITGIQLVFLTHRYFRIDETNRVQYELSSIMELE